MPVLPGAEPFAHDGSDVGVLLIHGFSGNPHSLRPWGEHLAEAGYTVRVPRLPGHGTTWQEMNRTRWEDWYGEVVRAFDKLAANCDQVVAGGLSMGAALALQLAEEKQTEVAGLLLVNPGLSSYSKLVPFRHVFKNVVPTTPGIKNDIKRPGQDELAYDRVPSKAAASMIDAWKHVIADLPKVTQPLLMFRSAEDHVVPPSSSQIILSKVSSRDLAERVLENSYHVATLDNDAPLIFEESVTFVRRVTGP